MEKYFAYDDCVLSTHKKKHTGARPLHSCRTASGSTYVPLRSDTENGGEGKERRSITCHGTTSMEPQSELLRRKRKPALVRSKTFDPSLLSQVQSDTETKLERKKSQSNQYSKTNTQYHKLFKEISKDEQLRQSYTCALQKDILYQGRLFVSDNWICFHSKVFGKDTKIVIPVLSVTVIKKTKTAILVPNALLIATSNERHVFVSFLSRDTTYKIIMSVCFHLEKSTGNSPVTSSAECSFRVEPPATLPLDFCADFSDLDGKVRKRRQEMEDSSSSDSPSPDCQKMDDYSKPPKTFVNVTKVGELPVIPEPLLQHAPEIRNTHLYNGVPETAEIAYEIKSLRPVSLSTLLMVYLFLVCVLVLSSCYMAFRIVSLEQRLTSLGSMTEPPDNGHFYHKDYPGDNAEVYSMLSMNILKLEKLQRNLQRLLEEAQ